MDPAPKHNQENGKQGEFRGPHYDGWREELQSGSPYDGYPIRYSDERIWKPGTPGYKPEYEKKFGANLIWWSTQDSAFENWATLEGWDPRARRVDNNVDGEGKEDLVWGENGNNQGGPKVRDRGLEIQPTGDITNGLIRVGDSDPYRNSNNPGRATLGEELKWENGKWVDHHNTKTRIFGHYHLAWADQEKGQIQPVSLNSYSGARSFVAQVKNKLAVSSKQQRTVGGKSYMHEFWSDLESPPNEYSIGAVPTTLKYVQYGRVTTKLDLADGENLLDNGFLRAPLTYKNDPNGVDHYFFRGVNATSIEQMAALPSDAVFQYSGHALMYGINNRFHGITGDANNVGGGHSLPNALGFDQAKMGLGNFVDATFNVGQKKSPATSITPGCKTWTNRPCSKTNSSPSRAMSSATPSSARQTAPTSPATTKPPSVAPSTRSSPTTNTAPPTNMATGAASSARPKPAAVAATPSRETTATTCTATTIRNRPKKTKRPRKRPFFIAIHRKPHTVLRRGAPYGGCCA